MTGTARGVRAWLVSATCCVAVAGVAGCADDPAPDPRPTSSEEPTVADPSSSTTPAPGGGATQLAVDDLAAALGVDAAEVEVVAVEEVTWRNGSRGCAKPGDMYTQALIDGARITLRVAGTDYEYHSGGSQPPALCESPTE